MVKSKKGNREDRFSTTDRYGIGTEKVIEDITVIPPSHLLKERGCALTGGLFLKKLNMFLDGYYRGEVVLGRSREMEPIDWGVSGVDRSPHQFFTDYPPIVREDPFTIFKETRPVKR